MSRPEVEFYVTGGTLPRSAPSYIERHADRELAAALCRGEFCYVLTPRQMGKSPLMVRTAARLEEAGVAVAVLDLTAIGQNLTAEQWYDGMLNQLGLQLGMQDELDDFWLNNGRLGPLQRFIAALREVVLPGIRIFRYAGMQGRPEPGIQDPEPGIQAGESSGSQGLGDSPFGS